VRATEKIFTIGIVLHCEKSLLVLASPQKILLLRSENPAVDTRTIYLLPIDFFTIPLAKKRAENPGQYLQKRPENTGLLIPGGRLFYISSYRKVMAGKSWQVTTDTAGKSRPGTANTAGKSRPILYMQIRPENPGQKIFSCRTTLQDNSLQATE
jgi:hypothetical protein